MDPSFIYNAGYREYVSEKTKVDIGRDNSLQSVYVDNLRKELFPSYRDGGNVLNSHLYPNYKTTFIKPYEYKKILPSRILNEIDKTKVYDIHGKGYSRANMPNKMKPYWE